MRMQSTCKINNLLFILDGYPYNGGRSCVFARNMIVAMADLGINCTVIAPQIITPSTMKNRQIPYYHEDVSPGGRVVSVYSPRYIYYPGKLGFVKGSMNNHFSAVMRTIQKEKIKPDAVYGHFVFQCGLTASRVGQKLNIPSFLGAGESDKLMSGNKRCNGVYESGVKKHNWRTILDELSGVVCVSEWTKRLLYENGFLSENMKDKTEVFINGVNKDIFKPADKCIIREKLGLSQTDFIVAFVGAFNDNKGVMRLSQAMDNVPDAKVVFLGSGALKPDCQNILFIGSCDNNMVANYLQAADCFVLPTRSEGCCNAIVEALSCGLPVVSSDLPFNDGILDETNSIRINPDNVEEISDAIKKLYTDVEYRRRLSESAMKCAREFGISERAKRIIAFMEKVSK